MSLRKQTDGRVFKKEFIELDEMRKSLFAGNPSDSDPGYEVPHAVHCSTISRGPTNCKKGTQRGPNFEQKGDLFDVKGDQNLNFSELFTKSENVKIVKKSHSFVFSNKLTYN